MTALVLSREAEAALRRYRAFYRELFALKHLLRAGDFSGLLGETAMAGRTDDQTLHAVRQKLRTAILVDEGVGADKPALGRRDGISPGYVCAAVADAALLHDIDWPGRARWAETPLEVLLYRTRIAGDRIFDAIDDLVAGRQYDAEATALTILLAFETGYRGRYRDADDGGEIGRLKARLFEFVFRVPPTAPSALRDLVVGAEGALVNTHPVSLPAIRPWLMAIVGLALAYLFVSFVLWRNDVGALLGDAARAAAMTHQISP
jgi:type VI secretion system protein ImpK